MDKFNSSQDYDQSETDEPYTIQKETSGWFVWWVGNSEGNGIIVFLLILAIAAPFVYIAKYLYICTNLIVEHLYISVSIYYLLVYLLGHLLFKSSPQKILGIISTFIVCTPLTMVETFYCIPYIMYYMEKGFFTATLEWLLVTALVGGLTIFIIILSRVVKRVRSYFIMACIFCTTTFSVLYSVVSSSTTIGWDFICSIYNL